MDHEDVVRAEELVVADRRACDPSLSYRDALQDGVDAAARLPLHGDDELTDAYRLVLATRTAPTRGELLALLAVLQRRLPPGSTSNLDVQRRVWLWQLQRGALR